MTASTLSQSPSRLEWVDFLKGIAIFFVVVGHMPCADWFLTWIYSFHMPLFFMASGFFLTKGLNQSFGSVALKRAKRLLIPYYFYGYLLNIPYFIFFAWFTGSELDLPALLKGQAVGIRWGFGMSSALWFLPCLFVASLIVWLIWKHAHKYRWALTLLISAVGIAFTWRFMTCLPYSADLALIAVLFIALGILLIKHVSRLTWPVALIALAVNIVTTVFNGRIDMWSSDLGASPLLFLLGSVSGCIFIVKIAMTLRALPFFVKAGKYSLTVYLLHVEVKFPFAYVLYTLDKTSVADQLILLCGNLLSAVVIIYICLFLNKYIEKYIPWSLGLDRRPA